MNSFLVTGTPNEVAAYPLQTPAAAITAPAMITPAAAQANLGINLSFPGPDVPMVGYAPQPVYYGYPAYHRWEERRAWEREHWRREEWRREEWREHHWR